MPSHFPLLLLGALLLLTLASCQLSDFELVIRPNIDRSDSDGDGEFVGVGLTIAADVENDCEHCDSISSRDANAQFIEADDRIDAEIRPGGGILVRARSEARLALRVFAPQEQRFVLEAKMPARAQIDWDYGWNLDGSDEIGPVFAGSEITLVQRHYSEDEEPLHGTSPYSFNRGSSDAELLAPPEAAPYYYATNSVFFAGETLGDGSITTETGAGLNFSVVDATAVASIAFYDSTPSGTTWTETAEPRSAIEGSSRASLRIVPFSADGQPIAGCPRDAYAVEISGEAFFEPNPYVNALCEISLKAASDATVTVTWGAAQATLEVLR